MKYSKASCTACHNNAISIKEEENLTTEKLLITTNKSEPCAEDSNAD
jgi:hypothetical protein